MSGHSDNFCELERRHDGQVVCRRCAQPLKLPRGVAHDNVRRACKAAPHAPPPNDACLHRGQVLRELACGTCNHKSLTLHVYSCAVHGECLNASPRKGLRNDIKLCGTCPERKPVEPDLPSKIKQAWHLARDKFTDLKAGQPRRSPERISDIFHTHCAPCPLFNSIEGACSKCGCPVSPTEPEWNRIALAELGCGDEERPRWHKEPAAAYRDLLFHLPPGIGDCSWIYSKIAALAETRSVAVCVAGGDLPRAAAFVGLLPNLTSLGYERPFNDAAPFLPPDSDLRSLPPGEYHLFANRHLEAGGKLADLWPRQETRYHYRLNTTPAMSRRAEQILGLRAYSSPHAPREESPAAQPSLDPIIGFYACAGRNTRGENIWSAADWLELLEGVVELHPSATLVANGAHYDARTIHVARELRRRGHRVLERIGCHIGVGIEVIRRLDYFFAYPSGLGILADVVDTPCLMFYWPDFHDRFPNTYADPANVASGRHLNLLFPRPREALEIYARKGMTWTLQRCRQRCQPS